MICQPQCIHTGIQHLRPMYQFHIRLFQKILYYSQDLRQKSLLFQDCLPIGPRRRHRIHFIHVDADMVKIFSSAQHTPHQPETLQINLFPEPIGMKREKVHGQFFSLYVIQETGGIIPAFGRRKDKSFCRPSHQGLRIPVPDSQSPIFI